MIEVKAESWNMDMIFKITFQIDDLKKKGMIDDYHLVGWDDGGDIFYIQIEPPDRASLVVLAIQF